VDYVSENIVNQSEIKQGNLCFNKRKYNTLLLIDVESLHPKTAEQLLKFVETGGKIICIDTIPYQALGFKDCFKGIDTLTMQPIDTLPRSSVGMTWAAPFGMTCLQDDKVKATMEKVMQFEDRFVFVEPPQEGFIGWYDSLMHAESLPHYLDIESPDPYVMQNRYTTDDGGEMVLLCNSHRYNAHQTKITFSKALTNKRQAQIWDLQTGQRYALPLDEDNSYTFDLGPVESVLVVFEKTKPIDLPIWQPLHSMTNSMSSVDLSENWDIELCHSLLHDTISTHFDTLFDLKDNEKYQHFCGTIVYHKTIDIGRDIARNISTILDLGLVEGVSEVFVNGQSVGVQYYGRRIYDISDYLQDGTNDLEIHVTTTMGNYLKTFSRKENPTTWVYVNHPRREQPLQSMGLLGPVKLYQTTALKGQPDLNPMQAQCCVGANNTTK